MKRHVLIALAVAIPLALFFVAQRAASWRPQQMAADSPQALMVQFPDEGGLNLRPPSDVARSRGGRWLAIRSDNAPTLLWEMGQSGKPRDLGRGLPVFSPDERLLATVTPTSRRFARAEKPVTVEVRIEDLQTHRVTTLQPVRCSTLSFGSYSSQIASGIFSSDNQFFSAVSGTNILRWSVATGQLISHVKGELFNAEQGIALFDEGRKVWTSSRGGSLVQQRNLEHCFVYDALTGRREQTFEGGGFVINERFYWANRRYDPNNFWIRRFDDNKKVLDRKFWTTPLFTPDRRWMLVFQIQNTAMREVQLLEVGTWRVAMRRKMPAFDTAILEDKDHLLTLSRGYVQRWRLR